MDEEYDAIILGTGLKECIVSGLLAVAKKKVRAPRPAPGPEDEAVRDEAARRGLPQAPGAPGAWRRGPRRAGAQSRLRAAKAGRRPARPERQPGRPWR